MSNTVILAEKPSQARSYVEAFQKSTKKQGYYEVSDPVLPDNTKITFGFGHLVELATPEKYDSKYKKWALSDLPIFPEKYKFIVGADKKTQFNIVKQLLNEADTIIVATDSDREGENTSLFMPLWFFLVRFCFLSITCSRLLYKTNTLCLSLRKAPVNLN